MAQELFEVGQLLYAVYRKFNYNRIKLETVIDGELWYRYDKPKSEPELHTYKILGRSVKTVTGEWDKNEPYAWATEYYVRALHTTTYEHKFTCDDTFFEDGHTYMTLEEAEAAMERMREELTE